MTRQNRQFSGQGQIRGDERYEAGRGLDRMRDDERIFGERGSFGERASFGERGSFGGREASFAERGDRTYEGYPRYERDEGWDRDEENARFGRNEGRFDQAWSRGRDEGWRSRRDDAGGGFGPGGIGGLNFGTAGQGSGGTGGVGFAGNAYGGGGMRGGGMSHSGYGGSMGGGNFTAGRAGRGDWFQDQDRFGAHVTQQMDRGSMGGWGGHTQYEQHPPHGGGIGSGWRDQGNARMDRGYGAQDLHAQDHGQTGIEQSPYGQSPYGQGNYGQGNYGQVNYGQSNYGQGMGLRGNAMGGWGRTSGMSQASGGMGQDRPHIGKGPKGYTRSDERIREEVCDCLSDGYVDASNVEVDVKSGVVTLTGQVTDKQSKRQIEDMVEGCRGVKTVENQIRVQGYGMGSSATSSSTSSAQGSSTNGEREDAATRGKSQRSSAS